MTVKPAYDAYWRLDKFGNLTKPDLVRKLTTTGFPASIANEMRPILVVKMAKLDRGLVPYENSTDAELKRFAEDRHLTLKESPFEASGLPKQGITDLQRWWRGAMIKMLEEADDAATFDKFLDLPPELRQRIYDLYLGAFPRMLHCPSQPPLARACRLLREEVLPMFYSHHAFSLAYALGGQAPAGPYKTTPFKPTIDTRFFLHSVPIRLVSNLRYLILDFPDQELTSRNRPRDGLSQFRIRVSKCTTRSKYRLSSYPTPFAFPSIRKRLEDVLQRAEARENGDGLRMSDIQAFRIAIEEGWADKDKPV